MRKSKYTKDLLEPIVCECTSMAQTIKQLGLSLTGGNYRMIACRIRLLGIRTDHFRGQGWAKGETKETHPGVAKFAQTSTRPDEEVFVENSPESCGSRLVKRLRRRGWKYEC